MKKFLFIFVLAVIMLFAGCSVHTSSNIDFDVMDITYVQDSRTGVIFAFVATRETGKPNATGMGMTVIPEEYYDKVKEFVK